MVARVRNALKFLSPRAYWREILAVLMLLLAFLFFRSERKELHAIIPQIIQAKVWWLFSGFILTVVYIFFQAGIYKKCFSAIGLSLNWENAWILFLKRNLVSIFLPAGGVSALAYSPSQIRKAGFTQTQVHQASGLFGFIGLLTVFVAGLPVVLFSVYKSNLFNNAWIGLLFVLAILAGLLIIVRSIKHKGKLYWWIDHKFPSFTPTINELFDTTINTKQIVGGVTFSMGVELCGMFHIYIAMYALGLQPSFFAAAAAYIIAVLLMVVSPFLRGLGAVELLMVYVLEQFGYSSAQALSITILYRFFEFWLPFIAGIIAFAWKGRKFFFRLMPALLTFALGIVNIISVVTPPMYDRLHALREFLPLTAIHASNLLVLFIGLSLLITAAFLFRGLRNAWIIALTLSVLSMIGHLTKAFDYEEAIIAAVIIVVLISTGTQYRIRSNKKWIQAGIRTAGLSLIAVLIFGYVSFYYIDVKHFGIDFTWKQSILHTLRIFLLTEDTSIQPITKFGHEFISLIRILGFLTMGFLLFALIQPQIKKQTLSENFEVEAGFLISQFGNSTMDYFKLYKDKLHFFSDIHQAFIAYRIAGAFAIVLEEPVCAEENKIAVLVEFERHCRKMGLKAAYYRVDENSMPWFDQLRKLKLIIGQEGILEIKSFTLEGKDKKSMRNGLNSLQKKGYSIQTMEAPHGENFLLQLRNVSDEWLRSFQKEEYIFSQGMFDEKEIEQQDVIILNDETGNIKAFLNIIPDYAEDECTYDLIRKTNDAPGAAMDGLIIQLIEYAKMKNHLYINLGMVPMTGIEQPDNTAEQIIKLAAAKIKRFQHYRGQREFKEKYATFWETKYLIYDNDFDLLQLPAALNNVMKP